jgi:uncharacterized protein (DUF4213/DUF364 family)
MIIDAVYQYIEKKYQGDFGNLHITDVRIGVFLCAIKLSNGFVGVASVIHSDEIHQVEKKDRDFGDFTPLKIIGKKISDLFKYEKSTATAQILKIASLNAYFQGLLNNGQYKFLEKTDPIDILKFSEYKNVVMIGAFSSYIRKISESGTHLSVLELDENAFLPHQKQFYIPSEKYKELLPEADMIIITGLTLVNNTFDGLLEHIPESSKSIMIGPSASMVPDIFFKKGIDMIGGTFITDSEKLFALAGQGAAGYHLFEYCAEKITVINEQN